MARQLKLSYIIEAIEQGGSRVLDQVSEKLDRLGRSYEGLAAMVGGGLEIKASIDEDSYFRQLSALTNTSFETMEKIKGHIHEVATESKIKIDEMVEGLAAFQRSGGAFADFDKSAKSAADAIAVLGGKGEEVGRVMAALDRSFDIKGPKKLREGLALVVTELGSVNADFHSFAQSFPELAEQYAAQGMTGFKAERDLVATFGTLAITSRSPRQAFGAVKEIMEDLGTDKRRLAFEGATGIPVQDAHGHMLPLPQIIGNIASAYSSGDRGRRFLIEANSGLSQETLFALQGFTTPEGRRTMAQMESVSSTPAGLDLLGDKMHTHAVEATAGIGGSIQKFLDELEKDSDWLVEHVLNPLAPALANVSGAGAGLLAVLGGATGLSWGIKGLTGALDLLRLSAGKAAASVEKEAVGAEGAAVGAGEGAAAAGLGVVSGAALAAGLGAAAVFGAEKGLDWLSRRIFGQTADEAARKFDWNKDETPSWLRWSEPSRWFHHDAGIPGVPDIHAAEDRPLGARGDTSRARAVIPWLEADGLSADQAAGVAAGAFAESGLNPDAVNPQTGAYGIGQWLGSRKRELFRRYGAHPSMVNQLDFMNWELHGGDPGGAAVLSEHSSGGVLDAYIRRFMRPELGSETLGDLSRGRNMLARLGGEITIKVEAGEGTKARIAHLKSSHPDVPLTSRMGVGMVAP